MNITPLFQIVTAIAFLYGNVIYYKLRRLAKESGYPIGFLNYPSPWPSINKMIQNERSGERKAELVSMKLKAQVSMVICVLGFIGIILSTVSE